MPGPGTGQSLAYGIYPHLQNGAMMSQDLEGIKEIAAPTPSFYRWENRETGGQERSQDYSVLEAQLRLMCWSPNS